MPLGCLGPIPTAATYCTIGPSPPAAFSEKNGGRGESHCQGGPAGRVFIVLSPACETEGAARAGVPSVTQAVSGQGEASDGLGVVHRTHPRAEKASGRSRATAGRGEQRAAAARLSSNHGAPATGGGDRKLGRLSGGRRISWSGLEGKGRLGQLEFRRRLRRQWRTEGREEELRGSGEQLGRGLGGGGG